jgi:hypothetical protein
MTSIQEMTRSALIDPILEHIFDDYVAPHLDEPEKDRESVLEQLKSDDKISLLFDRILVPAGPSNNKPPLEVVPDAPKKRGRPKGSKNKPKLTDSPTATEVVKAKKRGRPKGSKNKPKLTDSPIATEEVKAKKRGRPKGSKNKAPLEVVPDAPKKRGRPKGSKNRSPAEPVTPRAWTVANEKQCKICGQFGHNRRTCLFTK